MKRHAVAGVFVSLGMGLGLASCAHVTVGTPEERAPASGSLVCTEPWNFCGDPTAVVCSDDDQHKYLHVTHEQAEALSADVATKIAEVYHIDPVPSALDAIMAFREKDLAAWGTVYHAYLAEFERRLFQTIGATRAELNRYFALIRKDEMQAIDARPFPKALRKKLKAAIAHVKLELPSEYFGKDTETLLSFCGNGAINDDAFASHAESTVVLCPIYLLLGHQVDLHASFTEEFAASYETLAHELGHFIDTNIFETELNSWHDCLRDVRGLSTQAPENGVRRIEPGVLSELTADGWAVATVAEKIRTMPRDQAITFLREAYHNYCSGDVTWDDQDPHMPEMPRVNLQLSQTPSLRARMGCTPPTPALPQCDISGVVTGEPEF